MGGLSGEFLAALQRSVSGAAGSFRIERATPVAGGCIHRCFMLEGGGRRYFAKTNDRSALDSFAAEAEGSRRWLKPVPASPSPCPEDKRASARFSCSST